MSSFADLTALIIEPNAGMRASMHNMLNQCGVTKIDHALSSGAAIAPIRAKTFDLVMCEYTIGDGQDGQQLLEDLRHNKLIPLSTMFFIITAESSPQKVVGAAELTPSDYILKPFTADTVQRRLTRAVERREAFMPVYQLMEQGSLRQAVEVCIAGEENNKQQVSAFQRLRAELHFTLGEPKIAEVLYTALFKQQAVAWAGLGLAKSYYLQDRLQEAEDVLTSLVAQNRHFLEAYDWLARIHEARNQLSQAQRVLQEAATISPHAVRRLRRLGEVASQTGDIVTAERAFLQVVSKARFSEFRDPEDHVRLVRTLVARDDTQQAAAVIRDLAKVMGGSKKGDTCRALSAAIVHAHTGDSTRAVAELGKALDACRGSIGISAETKIALVECCLAHDLETGAGEVMLEVMSNAPDARAQAKAMAVFEQAGHRELADGIVAESKRRVAALVSSGAEKAKQGDFRGAVVLMTEAVQKLPDNPQVVFNAAVAALKCLENLGWDLRISEQARAFIATARRLDPANPRLAPLAELYQVIVRKYSSPQATVASTNAR
ncbi:MAG: response regulator [Pseudomonadota bacterium]